MVFANKQDIVGSLTSKEICEVKCNILCLLGILVTPLRLIYWDDSKPRDLTVLGLKNERTKELLKFILKFNQYKSP